MGFFEENKALIITVLLFSVLLLAMYNINMSTANKKARETLVELQNYRTEEPAEEKQQDETPPEPPKPAPKQPNLETHQAYNQNQEESRQNFESRLEEILQKNAEQRDASEEEQTRPSTGEQAVTPKRKQQARKRSDGDNNSSESAVKPGTMKNSSISFSLVGRNAVNIPNPIYTCESSGRIVVNVKVNEQGFVTNTSINKSSSSTSNECLTEKALEYASDAVFSSLAGRKSQPGTITYNFQGQ